MDADASLDHVFFPDSGVISMVAVYSDGRVIEMATIGREGCTGAQAARLGLELWHIWRSLRAGSPLELVHRLEPGSEVVVVSGALKGLRGQFERWGQGNRLVLWVELLGAGAAMEIDEAAVARIG